MKTPISQHDLSLKALELLETCARKGSLQEVAKETGLSVSTVSHHLRKLEAQLGVDLFDHRKRPMTLTVKGQMFLRNIEDALHAIRSAKAEISAGDADDIGYLRIGTIEDFDSDIVPELAVHLSSVMERCDFLYHTDTSLEILSMLHSRKLDLGITSHSGERTLDLTDRTLLRDPFVLVMPTECQFPPETVLKGKSDLPFLRFSGGLMIARQIEAQLRRLGISLPRNFECGNNQTLMAMVAASAGWTITTPLLFSRAKRFQKQLALHQFPAKSFSRNLAVIASPDCSNFVVDIVEKKIKELVQTRIIMPMHEQYPWLEDRFCLSD